MRKSHWKAGTCLWLKDKRVGNPQVVVLNYNPSLDLYTVFEPARNETYPTSHAYLSLFAPKN